MQYTTQNLPFEIETNNIYKMTGLLGNNTGFDSLQNFNKS